MAIFAAPVDALPARPELLASAARGRLERLGLWASFSAELDEVPALRVTWGDDAPYEIAAVVSAWGGGRAGTRRRIARLWRTALADAGIAVGPPTTWRRTPGGWRVGDRRVPFLVDATGRAAVLARSQGARRVRVDRLVAVAMPLPAGGAPRFDLASGASGWGYILRSRQAAGAVYLTDADLLRPAGRSPGDVAHEHLAAMGIAIEGIGAAQVTAAGATRLTRAHGPGWRAIGDAAWAPDPLSGSGVLRALDDAAAAATQLDAALDRHHELEAPASTWTSHLEQRLDYYGAEGRWPASTFWARRRRPPPAALTIDPLAEVVDAEGPTPAAVEVWLAPTAVRALRDLCAHPRAAHAVLAALRSHRAYPGDSAALRALQFLVDEGVCRVRRIEGRETV
ncbi:MAG: hypothetical protein RIT81_19145 [Deltaproteobacteria bacterium]